VRHCIHHRPKRSTGSPIGWYAPLTATTACVDTELGGSVSVMGIDQAFAALADPVRIEIVTRLSRGPASVSEIAEPYAMSMRGILKQVQVVEDAGLVTTVKDGRVRRCELQSRRLDEATRWIERVRHRWERRMDRLEDYAKEEATR